MRVPLWFIIDLLKGILKVLMYLIVVILSIIWWIIEECRKDVKKALIIPIILLIIASVYLNSSSIKQYFTASPTPTKTLSEDIMYHQYMRNVMDNEWKAYQDALFTFLDSWQETPLTECLGTDDVREATSNLKHAAERAPLPQHPSLLQFRSYFLQAMEKQLDALWCFDKGCVSMDVDEIRKAFLYQEEVATLLEHAGYGLRDYERGLEKGEGEGK